MSLLFPTPLGLLSKFFTDPCSMTNKKGLTLQAAPTASTGGAVGTTTPTTVGSPTATTSTTPTTGTTISVSASPIRVPTSCWVCTQPQPVSAPVPREVLRFAVAKPNTQSPPFLSRRKLETETGVFFCQRPIQAVIFAQTYCNVETTNSLNLRHPGKPHDPRRKRRVHDGGGEVR